MRAVLFFIAAVYCILIVYLNRMDDWMERNVSRSMTTLSWNLLKATFRTSEEKEIYTVSVTSTWIVSRDVIVCLN